MSFRRWVAFQVTIYATTTLIGTTILTLPLYIIYMCVFDIYIYIYMLIDHRVDCQPPGLDRSGDHLIF